MSSSSLNIARTSPALGAASHTSASLQAGTPITVSPSLVSFVVFTSSAPLSEDLDKASRQICFYHPPNTRLNEKVKQVGLLMALINFCATFSTSKPCEVIRTRKTRGVLRCVEEGFWIFVKIRLGARVMADKSGKKLAEYLDSELQDSLLEQLIARSYSRFKLFHNSFQSLLANAADSFADIVEVFFSNYLSLFENLQYLDLLTSLDGLWGIILFLFGCLLPLSRSLYLHASALVEQLESSFSLLTKSCLFYKHYQIWSGIDDLESAYAVYDYLTDPETGKLDDGIINQVKNKGEVSMSTDL
eukprot:jgi/Hompol1/749/HPOL_005402-RA